MQCSRAGWRSRKWTIRLGPCDRRRSCASTRMLSTTPESQARPVSHWSTSLPVFASASDGLSFWLDTGDAQAVAISHSPTGGLYLDPHGLHGRATALRAKRDGRNARRDVRTNSRADKHRRGKYRQVRDTAGTRNSHTGEHKKTDTALDKHTGLQERHNSAPRKSQNVLRPWLAPA